MITEILIAIGHIVGSVLVNVALNLIIFGITSWFDERKKKRIYEEISVQLGVSVSDLNKEDVLPKFIQVLSDRFSSELLRNRLSDFCGALQTLWTWLEWLTQAAVLIGVVWFTITENLDNAVFAWFLIPITLFFSITTVVFALICLLFTGRTPGQAKDGRKFLAEYLKTRPTKEKPDEKTMAEARLEAFETSLTEADLFFYELKQGLVPDGNSKDNPGYGPMDFDEWQEWKQREFERTGNLWHNHPGGLPPKEDASKK